MELVKFLFVLIELAVVINSSYPPLRSSLRSLTFNRFRPPVLRQCETPVLKNGSVRLRQRGKLIRYLCSPTFILIGDKYSSCLQGQWENPVPMCIKPGCPNLVPPDNGFIVPSKNGALAMLFCTPGYSLAGSQETFCDGKVWDRSLGSCRETQTTPVMSCDFEVSTICDWVADPTHDFEWTRKNGYTSVRQLQTGPAHDHTVGIPLEGHFMLATFANQLPSSVARLISPIYPANASQNACFRLYYHMYGATTGILRVYVKPESVAMADILDAPKYIFMEKLGTFQNAWLEAIFDIDQYDEDFQIVIEATASRTTRSNIAIDDVALLSDADCVNEESKSTAVTPEEGGIFDAQSCVSRCQETAPYSTNVTEEVRTSTNETFILLHCDCFDGCEDLKSCCLDYRSVCVFDVSTIDSTDSELNSVTEIIAPNVISTSIPIVTSITPASTSTVAPTSTSTNPLFSTTKIISTTKNIPTSKVIQSTSLPTTAKTIPTTTKTTPSTPAKTMPTTKAIPIFKTASTTLTPLKLTQSTIKLTSLTTPSTTSPTSPTTLKIISRITTKALPPRKIITLMPPTTIKRTTTVPTTKITAPATQKTSLIPVVIRQTTWYLNTSSMPVTKIKSKNVANDEWHSEKSTVDTDPLTTNLLISFGVVLLIGITTCVAIFSYKFYRKDPFIYKTKSKRFSEDASDEVRFLPGDEHLDFGMQT